MTAPRDLEDVGQQDPTARPRFFRGWVVVAAAFVVTLVGFGSAYTFSAFVDSLQREFGASRGSVSLVFSLAGFLYFGLGVVTGPLADRWGARRLVILGMVLVGCGLLLAGRATTLGQVYAAYALGVGLGVGCAYVPALGAVQRWFNRRRGLASGLAVSGIGVGTLVLPALAIGWIEHFGWREAYWLLGIVALVVGVAAAAFIEDDPSRRGLGPDGQPAAAPGLSSPSAGRSPTVPGLSLAEAVRTRRFLGLYASGLVCGLGVFVPFVHLVPFAVDQGIAPAQAALLLGAIGIGSTAGRFLLGGVADRVGRDRFLVAMYVGMAVTLSIWALASLPSGWIVATPLRLSGLLTGFALGFGLFYGGWVAIMPAVVTDYFGGRQVSGVIGVLYTSVAFGTLVGPVAAGHAYDLTASYRLPIIASVIANLVAGGLAIATMRTPAPWHAESPSPSPSPSRSPD